MTHSDLLRTLSYDPLTGVFTRLIPSGPSKIGDIAGWIARNGYGEVRMHGKRYLLHRLAWFYVYGEMPALFIDHVNGIRSDNRIINLREATRKQNGENMTLTLRNKSGYRGVSWSKSLKKWVAQVGHHGGVHYIGAFDVVEDAAQAALKARNELFTHNKTCYSA